MGDRTRYALDRALAELPDGVRYQDPGGQAVYQVEPDWATAIACGRCRYVSIIPTLPRSLVFTHSCSSCGAPIVLRPPLEVIGAGPTGSMLRGDQSPRPT